jgi:hypothetical protein
VDRLSPRVFAEDRPSRGLLKIPSTRRCRSQTLPFAYRSASACRALVGAAEQTGHIASACLVWAEWSRTSVVFRAP